MNYKASSLYRLGLLTARGLSAGALTSGSLALGLTLLLPVEGRAQQVVYSVGTQQVYDSNIFLEDESVPSENLPTRPDGSRFEEFDGDKNSDMISNPYVSAAGRVNLSPKLITNFSARVGAMIFSDNDRENRSTVDGLISITPEQGVLPDYWTFFVTEALSSQANAVGIAQGASTRQGQQNTLSIGGGLNNYALSDRTAFTATISSARQDFLGQFLFSSNDDTERVEIEGVDSFTHSFQTRVNHQVTQKLNGFVGANVNYFDVTGGESNNLGVQDTNDNDRVNLSPTTGFNYTATEKLQLGASVGVDFSRFANSREGDSSARDKTQSNLHYGANLSYILSDRSLVGLNIVQSGGTDIDGNRILVRTVGANGSYMLSNKASANLSGQFTQFDQGDSLSRSSERYEGIASLRYSLMEALAVSVGYSYVNQKADGGAVGGIGLFNSGDFDGHRAFVSLDTGFVAFQ